MVLEPSSVQRDRMLSHEKTKLTLIQFLIGKDRKALEDFLGATRKAVLVQGGNRDHQLLIDQVLSPGELTHRYLIVDSFPSSQALLLAHENTRQIRSDALIESYSIYLKPKPAIKKITRSGGVLALPLARLLGTQQIKEGGDLTRFLNPQAGPTPENIKQFSSQDPDQPFYMMSLKRFSPRIRGRLTGKTAYNLYAARIIPYLLSVGGFPDISSRILGTYIGDQQSNIAGPWHEFALVYYPSRISFLKLLANIPRRTAVLHQAAVEKTILMACLPYP